MGLLCGMGIHQKSGNFYEIQSHNGLDWLFYICPKCETRFHGSTPGKDGTFERRYGNVPDGNKRYMDRMAQNNRDFERVDAELLKSARKRR